MDAPSAKGIFAQPATHGLVFRKARRRKAKELTSAFAERLAEHGDICRAAREIGVSSARGHGLFRRICDELGEEFA